MASFPAFHCKLEQHVFKPCANDELLNGSAWNVQRRSLHFLSKAYIKNYFILLPVCIRELWLGLLHPQSDTEHSPGMEAVTEGSPLLLWLCLYTWKCPVSGASYSALPKQTETWNTQKYTQ